jgi:hypothetical protein
MYDQNVSREVQQVCQALAMHDRLGPFDCCFVRRNPTHKRQSYRDVEMETEEIWFPGESNCDFGSNAGEA